MTNGMILSPYFDSDTDDNDFDSIPSPHSKSILTTTFNKITPILNTKQVLEQTS